jgi:transposase
VNVLKPHLRTTLLTLLASNTSQREIARVTKIDRSKTIVCKQLKGKGVMEYFASLEPHLTGMEASGGAHHWTRLLKSLGHEVQLLEQHQ